MSRGRVPNMSRPDMSRGYVLTCSGGRVPNMSRPDMSRGHVPNMSRGRVLTYPGGMPADLYFLGEGGREHHSLSVSSTRHAILLHNTTNLRLKTHVQHTISFIQNQKPNTHTHHRLELGNLTEHSARTRNLTQNHQLELGTLHTPPARTWILTHTISYNYTHTRTSARTRNLTHAIS